MILTTSSDRPYVRLAGEAMERLYQAGWQAFTPHELAREMGRAATSSLRRVLIEMERRGHVRRFTFWTEKGGMAVAYEFTRVNTRLPLGMDDDTQADF